MVHLLNIHKCHLSNTRILDAFSYISWHYFHNINTENMLWKNDKLCGIVFGLLMVSTIYVYKYIYREHKIVVFLFFVFVFGLKVVHRPTHLRHWQTRVRVRTFKSKSCVLCAGFMRNARKSDCFHEKYFVQQIKYEKNTFYWSQSDAGEHIAQQQHRVNRC